MEKKAFLALLGDRPIAYHPLLARVLGGVKEALFVSQIFYWYDRGHLPDGWVWKTQKDFERETGLSRWEQETARRNLRKLGVLDENKRGIPQRLHYHLNLDCLFKLVETYLKQECGKTTFNNVVTPQTISETTSEITAGEEKEENDFLSQTPKPDRERIRDLLIDVLADGMVPESDFLMRPFENGVDTLVLEFRKMYDKKRLDPELTSKILAAIRGAYEDENNWQFARADTPTTPVIACIVAEGRQGPLREAARAEWQEASRRSQEALAGRQAAPERAGDLWWGQVLEELSLQMSKAAFDAYLRDTQLLAREGDAIRVAVQNEYILEWIENRLRPVIDRALAVFGIAWVDFEVLKGADGNDIDRIR